MPRESIAITNFSAGERGPLTAGRIDWGGYNNSLTLCENFIPTSEGPLVKRKGFKYIAPTKGNVAAILIPYDPTWTLILTQTEIQIYTVAGVYQTEIATPAFWAGASIDINAFDWAQTEDLLMLAHPDMPPYVFTYDGTTALLTEQDFHKGPLDTENVDDNTTYEISGVTGAVTIRKLVGGVATTFGPIGLLGLRCIPQMLYDQWATGTVYGVGAYVWSASYESDRVNVYKTAAGGTSGTRAPGHDTGVESDGVVLWEMVHSEYGFIEVSGIGNPLAANGTVVGFPEIPVDATVAGSISGWGSWRWSIGFFMQGGNGYFGLGEGRGPRAVTFHQQRVVYGYEQRILGSTIDNFIDFHPRSSIASAAYNYKIGSDDANFVRFLSYAKNLVVGASNGVFTAKATSGGPITPTDINLNRDSRRGVNTDSVQVGESVLYVQTGGVGFRESVYSDDTNGYKSLDIGRTNKALIEKGVNKLIYQGDPTSIVWSYTDDGILLGLTHEREMEVVAFHRHTVGGDVESVTARAGSDGNDHVWAIVNRTIGGTKRYIEILDESNDCWLDSYIEYTGGSTTSLTGLSHLEGEVVTVVAGDAINGTYTVSSGAITTDTAVDGTAEGVFIGLDYDAIAVTQKLEGGSQNGVSQGKLKRIHSAIVRVDKTGLGLKMGSNSSNVVDVLFRDTNDLMDSGIPVYTGDQLVPLKGGNDQEGVIRIEHTLPLPCTIVSLWPQIEVSDNT